MQRLVLILVSTLIFTNCEPECSASPSCIAPPEGTFQIGKTNLAISPTIFEEFEPSSFRTFAILDSAVVHTGSGDVTIKQFYHWVEIGETPAISSIDFHYGEETTTIEEENFEFQGAEMSFVDGGYVLGATKEDEAFVVRVEKASQDLIDGVCNDTFDC